MQMPGDGPIDEQARPRLRREALRDVDLDTALSRRSPGGLRALWLAATAALLIVALIPAWRAVAPPDAVSSSARAEVTLTSNVSSGRVFVNGKLAGQGLPLTLRLPNGVNRIAVDVAPFKRRECRTTVPIPSPEDTCPARSSDAGAGATTRSAAVNMLLGIGFTAADLLPGQWDRVRSAVEKGLALRLEQLPMVIARGDHYAAGVAPDGSPIARVAATALVAVPTAALSSLAGDFACGAPLCPPTNGVFPTRQPSAQLVWSVLAGVTLGWSVRAPAGGEVARAAWRGGLTGPSVTLALVYSERDGWRVLDAETSAGSPDSLARQVAVGLCQEGAAALLAPLPDGSLLGTPGEAYLDGCALSVRRLSGSAPAEGVGSVVCRFGALLAADDTAHRMFPALPLADGGERNAAG